MVELGVDWTLVDQRLPIAQVPSAKARRDEMFAVMDTSGNGFITISEAQNGLPALLERGNRKTSEKASYLVPLRDLRPAVKLAFNVARKVAPPVGRTRAARMTHDTCVDRREFHALLVAFRAYLELDVIFEAIDQDGHRGRLNWKECEKALSLLEGWRITPKQARSKFPDDWTPTMDFNTFADWCVMRRFGTLKLCLDENDVEESIKDAAGNGSVMQMLQAFRDWDADGSGTIDADELAEVLMGLDPDFTREQAMRLFAAADSNNDGFVDYVEFMNWVTG